MDGRVLTFGSLLDVVSVGGPRKFFVAVENGQPVFSACWDADTLWTEVYRVEGSEVVMVGKVKEGLGFKFFGPSGKDVLGSGMGLHKIKLKKDKRTMGIVTKSTHLFNKTFTATLAERSLGEIQCSGSEATSLRSVAEPGSKDEDLFMLLAFGVLCRLGHFQHKQGGHRDSQGRFVPHPQFQGMHTVAHWEHDFGELASQMKK